MEQVCKQLQVDINRMKSQRAAVQRRMEAKEKDYREWRQMKEKEVLQLRRTNQRTVAALQQQEAMHQKQQVWQEYQPEVPATLLGQHGRLFAPCQDPYGQQFGHTCMLLTKKMSFVTTT